MYDIELTHQSLPDERYLYLLGVSISVFSSNNAFIIENILRVDPFRSWYELIDKTSGCIQKDIAETITTVCGTEIADKFGSIVDMRNRIVHGFRITSEDGEQIIATKDKKGKQYYIDKDYLKRFIRENDELSNMLHVFRGY